MGTGSDDNFMHIGIFRKLFLTVTEEQLSYTRDRNFILKTYNNLNILRM